MGKSGRQNAAGKRLAKLHQRISSDGSLGATTATPLETTAEIAEGNERPHEAPYDFAVRYATPKRRQATPARYQANQSTESPPDYIFASPPSENKSWPTSQVKVAEEKSREGLGKHRRGGPEDLYGTSGDEGESLGPGSTHDTAPASKSVDLTAIIPQGRQTSICLEQSHTTVHDTASKSSRLEAERHQLTGGQTTQCLGSIRNLSPKVAVDEICDSGTESATTSVRVQKSIRLRKRSTEPRHQQPNQKTIASSPTHAHETFSDGPHARPNETERISPIECDIVEGQSASPIGAPAMYNSTDSNSILSKTSPSSNSAANSSRMRAPSLNIKARKLRGRFDAATIKTQLGIDLPPDREQRLRDLSGNDMAAAINIYLQGYCNASAGQQSPGASSQEDSETMRTGSGSVSSIAFWQQKRQLEKQNLPSRLEESSGTTSKASTLSEENHSIKSMGNDEKIVLLPSRIGSSEVVRQSDAAHHTHSPLLRCEPSEKAASQDMDLRGHKEGATRAEGVQEGVEGDPLPENDGVLCSSSDAMDANYEGETSGTGPVPLRGMQGFTNQENVRPRNPPSSTSRLPNGKIGSGSGWGAFGMPLGGAPGLQTMQQRNMAGSGGMGSFTQNTGLGGSQPATPLDPSEFPSLSGAPQTQQQNPGQAIWAQRPTQQNPTPNPRQQPSQSSQQNPLQSQQQSQPAPEDMFSAPSHFATRLGDFGQGNQQLSGSNQPQTGSIDEFPPLGRESSSGLSQERRGSLLQNNAFGGYGASMAFAGMAQQQRNPLSNALDRERMASPAGSGMGLISSSRSPNPGGQNGNAGQEKLGTIGSGADSSSRQGEFSSQSQQQHSHQSSQMMNSTFGGSDIVDSPSSMQQGGPQSLEQMSDIDKFGLAGLLAMMHHPSPDLRSLTAQGQDLTALGLDLTSIEPLHTQLASVFNPNAHTRLPLDADYTLPACYRVANVQPLHERIPSFSEETLFYIFYSSPKDLVQELVADELIGRKWRFHKGEKMWVTRDENYPAPVEVEREISEQGFYIWWDWKGWKKVRRQYILRYEDLDNGATRNGSALNQMALSAAPSALAQAAGVFSR